jgi:hypothetical protein
MNRRQFLSAVGAAGLALGTRRLTFAGTPTTRKSDVLRIGVITDLHHAAFGKDQLFRLKAFIDAAVASSPDFILQGGDFCYPDGAAAIMAEWNRFTGDKRHVLGNHDMDKCDKATIMKLWEMEKPYYSFDKGGFHFIVLDRNFIRNPDQTTTDYAKGNWYKFKSPNISCIDDAQVKWLIDDLKNADKPTVVWIHQPLLASNSPEDIGNAHQIIDAFDAANFEAREKTGKSKVIAAFFGHDHDDLYVERAGVHYVLLNSASYAYTSAGASFYREPLYSFITLDPAGTITIEGKSTVYDSSKVPDKVRMRIFPKISDRSLSMSLT